MFSFCWTKTILFFSYSESEYILFSRRTIWSRCSLWMSFSQQLIIECALPQHMGRMVKCKLGWKEQVSVTATSGVSWAWKAWLLCQTASLELAGALAAACLSSHHLSIKILIYNWPENKESQTHRYCTGHGAHGILLKWPFSSVFVRESQKCNT